MITGQTPEGHLSSKIVISAVPESFPVAHCFSTKGQFQFSGFCGSGVRPHPILFQFSFLQCTIKKSSFDDTRIFEVFTPSREMSHPILLDFRSLGLLDSTPSSLITPSVIESILCGYGISVDTVHKYFD